VKKGPSCYRASPREVIDEKEFKNETTIPPGKLLFDDLD
jgi:hypothetical protein